MNQLVQQVRDWGRDNAQSLGIADTDRHFDDQFIEQLRLHLTEQYKANNPAVSGSYRTGWVINLGGGEKVGIGTTLKGDRKFRVFYHPSKASVKQYHKNRGHKRTKLSARWEL